MAFDPTQPFAAKPDYSEEFTEAGEAHGVDPLLLRAVADVESNGDRFAVSHAGAEGLMQIMPGTQRELGVTDPYDPRQSIHGGAKYLSEQHRRFGNPYSAIAAYNAGPGGNFDAQGVQDYVTNVTDRWRAYQANPPPQPKPKSGFDPNQPFTVAPPKGGGGFDPNQPFTVAPGGRGLTSKQAVKQLPVAPTEAEAPLPPIAHPGEPAPDTGWTEALTGGLSQAVRGPQQTYQAVTGGRPVVSQPTIAAAEPIKWADVLNPGLLGRKFVYGMAASAPEMVGFGVGAALAGGPETPVGMVAGAAGAALTHAATSLGPAFGVELQATPNDPDGAFNRAMQKTGVSSLFTGAMFGSFGIAPFQGALKNLMFQAFGLQPGLAVAEKATSNVMDGKPASEDLTEGVPGAVLMTAAPMAAHAGARWLKGRGAQPPEASPELQGAAADMTQAATPPPPPGATPPPPPPPPGPPVPPIVDLQAQAAGKPPSGTALPTLTAMAAEAEARPPTDIVTPKGGTQPLEAMSPVPPTTPEPPTDLHAQIAALADPNNPKDAVFIAAGTDWRPFSTSGAAMYWRPEGTLFTNNPAKARAYMDGPLDDAKLAQILGYPETKDQALAGSVPQGQAPVIVQGTDAAGNVVHESVASPAGVPAAQAAAESVATPAGGGVRVTDPVTAQVRRKEPVTGETPPVPAPKPAEPSINVPAPEPPRPPGQKPALREIEQPPTVGAGRLEDRIAASEAAGRISHADADYLREQFKDQIERERREQPPSAPEISETPSVSPAEPSQPSINVPAPEPPTEAAPPPAGERPMDSRGRPIFQKGDRVVTADGHHGTIAEAQVYRMQPIFGGGPSEPNYSYVVKTDRGRVVHPQEAMAPETGEAPHVVPDPVHAGHATDPETLQRNIDYDRRAAEQKRGAAARAVKRENKQGHINAAVAHEKSAAEKRAVLDAWKAQYPEEAARIFPPKAGAPAPAPTATTAPTPAGTGQLSLIETKHGKTGEKLFTVTMGERVERDRFTALRDAASQHGGKYSSYKGHGAVPGFEFRSREAAEQFLRDVRGEPPPELPVAGTTKEQIKALEAVWLGGKDEPAPSQLGMEEAKPTPEVSPPAAAPEARPADYGANNTIFTADAAAKARERLRAKLGRLSTGLDPEMMMDGLTLAGYHIEAGARSFADYASAMVNDLGEAARPYLRSWYESVRHFPGHDTTGMSNDAEIARHLQREAEAPISDPRPGEGHGLQEPVPESDAGQGAGDVGGTHPSEPTDGAPAGEEPGGPRTPGATPGERTEDAERPPMEHLGTAPGGGGGPRDTDRVPGEAGPEPGGATGRSPTNHVIAPGTVEETRSFRVKAADNLAAIELAKRIIAEDRPATPEEQAVLAKYVGWGGIPQAFEGKAGYGRGFETIGARLKEVLSPEEYATASRSTQYAHYTAENVVRAMWDAAEAMGFRGGSVFEPGMGIGHFLGMMPPDLAAKSRYDGIEFDHLTAQIAKLLYPESGIREADYFKTPMPEGHFDLAIGNPPFSDVVIREDPKYAPRRFMMHDYFFAKTLDSVRPGGLLGFVTSAGTMNKMDSAARNYLAERAEFVGGVRLPSSAFRRNAGTEVTTDILFFRKRDQRIPLADLGEAAKPWTDTVIRDLPNTKTGAMDKVSVNRYFSEHPEQVLGQEVNGEQYAGGRYEVVQHPDTDLTTDLRAALDRLPKDVMTEPPTPEQRAELDFASGQKKDGSYYIGPDGALMQYRGGAGRQVARRGASEEAGITAIDMQRIHHLIPLRDALRDVFRADLTRDDAASAAGREALNKHYDAFTKKFGPINKAEFQRRRPTIIQQETARLTAREEARAAGEYFDDGDFDPSPYLARGAKITEIAQARQQARARAQAMGRKFNEGEFDIADIPDTVIEKRPNVRPFMEDPESYRMRSIEHYDDETGTAIKKPIFFKNILTHEREPEINSANDGVLWSMNKLGRFDLQAIAAKMGRSPDAIISELGDAVFKVPDTRDTWQTHDEYLSGDVVSKLAAAQKAAETDPSVRRNIPALEAAQPVPLAPSEIAMTIGMPWMPHALLEQFANEHMKIGQLGIQHSPALGAWVLDKRREDRGNTSGMAEWQAGGLPASKLLEMAMNRVPPKIYATDPADRNKRIFDAVATQAAQDKIDTIKQAFNDWLAQDPARHNGMARIYNDALNRVVLRKYDGTYLSTPGVASDWTWRPHQTQVISRIILDGNTYMAHAVGAGKTSAMIGSAMEMRRLGLIKKPMFVVPNHMLQQFTKEFYEQYPTARIAVADEQRFHTDRRRQFISNVSQDDLDAVIITHSSFGMIPISDAFQDHLIHEQIEMVREALSGLDKKEDRFTVKRLENQLEALQQKLSKKKEGRDLTNTFEELGVDFLYVDEAQEFRKLQYATRQSGMKGIDPDGSDMAWDLYSKARYLDSQRPGRSLVLASGTPVTNTMGELYTVSRYLQPRELNARGIGHFDSWAQMFGDTKTTLEQGPAGDYQPQTRFSRFVNMPELYKMVGSVMDIVTPTELSQYVTRPALEGGKRQFHMAPKTPFLEHYQRELAGRIEAIKRRRGPPEKGDDILLSVINDGRHSAIDPRFVEDQPNDPSSKLNMMLDNVVKIYHETGDTRFYSPGDNYQTEVARGPAAQMVFANLGVNGRGPVGFSSYAWMKSALVKAGIPRNEIAFIGDYKTHLAKQALFNDMNAGRIRVLIGSTKKMGTGINAQKRLIALHNLDPLWFPADDEQRVGRILRQGNMNPRIQVHDYATKGTYDSTMWNMMGRKGRFIEQFFRGDPTLRDMEDLGEASMYEQAAAMSTSDERMIKLTEMRQDRDRMVRRGDAHDREQYGLVNELDGAKRAVFSHGTSIASLHNDIAQRVDLSGDKFRMTVGNADYRSRKGAASALDETIKAVFPTIEDKPVKIAEISGFPIWLDKETNWKGEPTGRTNITFGRTGKNRWSSIEAGTGDGVIRSVETQLRGLESDLAYYQRRLEVETQRVAQIEPLIGKQFEGRPEIERLSKAIRELEAELKTGKKAEPEKKAATGPRPEEVSGWLAGTEGGAYSRRESDEAPKFRNWFGASKVVDAAGKPLRVYHGTTANQGGEAFTIFDTYASRYGLVGMGGYFTEDPHIASQYATKGRGDTPTVYPAFLSIKHPLDMDARADPAAWAQAFDGIADYHEGGTSNESWYRAAENLFADQRLPSYEGAEAMQSGIVAMGHDGITHIGGGRVRTDSPRHRVWVAFDPEQIKSATGNRGTFDPSDPRIQYSRGERGVQENIPARLDDAARAKLQDAGERMMRAAGLPPSIALKLVDRITDAAGKPVSADAKYTRSLISLALDTPHDQIASKLWHEVTHAVLDPAFGLLKPGEIKVLEHAADRWLDKGTNRADLAGRGYSPVEMRAEAIARMGEDALARGLKPPEPYSKILRFIERLGNWLRDAGFHTADDVFNSIMRGEKRAEGATPKPGRVSQMARGPAPAAGSFDVLRDKQGVAKAALEIKAAFAPNAIRGAADQTALQRKHSAGLAADTARAAHELTKVRDAIDRLSADDQNQFTHDYETGQQQNMRPELQPVADALRDTIAKRTATLQGMGYLENAIEDYLGRAYSNYAEWKAGLPAGQTPAQAIQQALATGQAKRPLLGSGNFLKQRRFPTLREAMDAGLEPITHNPIDMALFKIREMDKYIHGKTLADAMKDGNIARFYKAGQEERDARSAGMVQLDDKIFQPRIMGDNNPAGFGRLEPGNWYAPEPAARLFNRYMSRGLAGHSIIYDTFRQAGNALNSAQLGLSGFHATFVSLDTAISRVALGIQQLSEGQIGRGLAGTLLGWTPASVVRSVRLGSQVRKALLEPATASALNLRRVEDLMRGGGRINMDAFYRTHASGSFFKSLSDIRHPANAFRQAWRLFSDAKGPLETAVKAPFWMAARVLESVNEPLMGQMVPRAKLGVFTDMADNWHRMHPNATEAESSAAMTRFWDSVDNRLGQMVYDNLAWNKIAKDIAFITTRSVGWNLGTVREIGGAVPDTARFLNDAAHGRLPHLTTRMAYTMAMPVVVGVYGAILTYLATGAPPTQMLDYFFPPNGGQDPDSGQTERRMIPAYIKDVIEYYHDPLQTVLNKTQPLLSMMFQLYNNKDYFGGVIYQPLVEGPETAYPNYLLNQAIPFSWRGYLKLHDKEAPMLDQALAFFGIQPAPASIVNPERGERYKVQQDKKALKARRKEEQKGYIHFFGDGP